jgi:hypothetical protein
VQIYDGGGGSGEEMGDAEMSIMGPLVEARSEEDGQRRPLHQLRLL